MFVGRDDHAAFGSVGVELFNRSAQGADVHGMLVDPDLPVFADADNDIDSYNFV